MPLMWELAYVPLAMGEQCRESEVPERVRGQREVVKRTAIYMQLVCYEAEDVAIDGFNPIPTGFNLAHSSRMRQLTAGDEKRGPSP